MVEKEHDNDDLVKIPISQVRMFTFEYKPINPVIKELAARLWCHCLRCKHVALTSDNITMSVGCTVHDIVVSSLQLDKLCFCISDRIAVGDIDLTKTDVLAYIL